MYCDIPEQLKSEFTQAWQNHPELFTNQSQAVRHAFYLFVEKFGGKGEAKTT